MSVVEQESVVKIRVLALLGILVVAGAAVAQTDANEPVTALIIIDIQEFYFLEDRFLKALHKPR